MIKALSLALLAGGVLLMIFGLNAYDSTSSDISRFFTGSATDKSIWLLVSGIVATIAGLVGLSCEFKDNLRSLAKTIGGTTEENS